jgi:hypothetical protein
MWKIIAFRRTLKAAVIIIVSCGSVVLTHAQSHQWVNQELRAKGTDSEQYKVIGRGDLAQCTSDAQQAVRQTFHTTDCSAAYSSSNPFVAQDCMARQEADKRNSEQMHKDLTLGCMAKRGWFWTATK